MARKPLDSWDNQHSEAAQCANTKRPLANHLEPTERQAALSMTSERLLPTLKGAK